MPITPSKTTYDSLAPLAWNATVAVLGLEKLRRGRSISKKEVAAMKVVADQLALLSEASQIRLPEAFTSESESLPSYLQESFFTLVAIESTNPNYADLPEFGQAGKDLVMLHDQLVAGHQLADSELLGRVKDVCVGLLEQLNEQRPAAAAR